MFSFNRVLRSVSGLPRRRRRDFAISVQPRRATRRENFAINRILVPEVLLPFTYILAPQLHENKTSVSVYCTTAK